MFTQNFSPYVTDGDCISCVVEGFTIVATLHRDDDSGPPDKHCDGFWPSLDPDSAGYIGDKSKRTLARHHAHARHVMDSWLRDEWHYYGIVLNVFKNGVQLTDDYAHATWGIEGNYPSWPKGKSSNHYFRDVANDYLSQALKAAKEKLATLCAA